MKLKLQQTVSRPAAAPGAAPPPHLRRPVALRPAASARGMGRLERAGRSWPSL